MLAGGALLLVISLLTGEPARFSVVVVSTRSVLALAYLSVFGSIIGYTAYLWLPKTVEPAKVGTNFYVNPVIAVFAGWLVAGETVTLQMVMGWSAVAWMPWIYRELGGGAIALIALGGACYTIGTVIYAMRRPRLFPRTFSHHELFHVLVIAGSSFHFFAILLYAIPATS